MQRLAPSLLTSAMLVSFLGCGLNGAGLSGTKDAGTVPKGDSGIHADASASAKDGRGGQGGNRTSSSSVGGGGSGGTSVAGGAGGAGGSPGTGGLSGTGGRATGGTPQTGGVTGTGGIWGAVNCGNGVVEPGETCDPGYLCPTSCTDGDSCTIDQMTGSSANCNVACSHIIITTCVAGDGCCPAGCNANTDSDCSPTCGNTVVEGGETCDPPSSCPTSCNDGNACTSDQMTGSSANCNVTCSHTSVTTCVTGDGCCPAGCNAKTDPDCSPTCGNGVVEPGETCDPKSSCPTSCNEGNACIIDQMTGSSANCNVACSHTAITTCVGGDGCCPAGCNANTDSDCSPTCDNGALETGETCDPKSSCPASCDDGNACTIDKMTGSSANCNVACSHSAITTCVGGDGCCPAGCNAKSDSDCSPTCGNGVKEPGETCDPKSSCPTSCNDGKACTIDRMTGSSANCNVACTHTNITNCVSADGCCPAGCNANTDSDCSPKCGNGVVERGETCDPKSSCPASCNDGKACTIDKMTGSRDTCNVACTHTNITNCVAGDGCCPAACNANTDSDCSPTCGNGAVEKGETCDPPSSCPTSCDDHDPCTIDQMTGSPAKCNVACTHTIRACSVGPKDNCCPAACNANTDSDCSPTCGNGAVEAGETCDPPSSCPASCDDGKACTIDQKTGSSANCNVACSHTAITTCVSKDGCCPDACDANGDSDCSPVCGNGVVEPPKETCDPPSTCPASCDDGEVCTIDQMTGSSATCDVACSHTKKECVSSGKKDGCCPDNCDANTDPDCSSVCGNGVVEPGETCDPPSTCPTSCDDGRDCTIDQMTGSSDECTLACSHTDIKICSGESADGCCPAGCDPDSDIDCVSTGQMSRPTH